MAKKEKKDKKDPVLSKEEQTEKTKVDKILAEYEYYKTSRQNNAMIWVECYKMYESWIDITRNPFLANLFIPKVHEAVELIAAFLIGTNQTITADPEGSGDTKKAEVAQKLLQFQWRKVLKARLKVLTWIKQAILFGNGIMKVGWVTTDEKDEPWMEPRSITDVFFDYYISDIQDSPSVIDRVPKHKELVMADEKYTAEDKDGTLIRETVVGEGDDIESDQAAKFTAYDPTNVSSGASQKGKVLLLEHNTLKTITTIAPTKNGWRILREIENPNKRKKTKKPFLPFVKVRFKISPLPNRAYDVGAIEPTIKIQKAFNDLINEAFDNISLINNKQWIKRKGANINPVDLVRRPGGVITVGNIDTDLKSEEVSDIKASLLEMIQMLDNEFQQASMVVNLLKGVPNADTATEASIGQSNAQTLLAMIDSNIKDAMSELGQMILDLDIENLTGKQKVKVFDTDKEIGFLEFDVKDIDGEMDVKISADRAAPTSAAVQQKQLLDFLAITSKDPMVAQKYPNLNTNIYKKWLENAGFQDVDYFFQEGAQAGAQGMQALNLPPGMPAVPGMAARMNGLAPGAAAAAVSPVNPSVNPGNIQP